MTVCLRDQDLDWRDIGDEIVAVDTHESVYLAAGGAGAFLWRRLAQPTTRHSLVEALVREYGIETTRAAADVDAFLATLSERRLLAS